MAGFGKLTGRGLQDVTSDPTALDSGGRWAVLQTFEGELTCARFADWSDVPPRPRELGGWVGPRVAAWNTSMSRSQFISGVQRIRGEIAAGSVYQVNLCRILSAPLPEPDRTDPARLSQLLAAENPAPFSGFIRVPGVQVATASPELFLERDGATISTGPIKGTGATASDISEKDRAENVMIVDLMRNDLARVSDPGSVRVPDLLRLEPHPGLVHLVSDVTAHLVDGVGWAEILEALSPAGSVSGAPKMAALDLISRLETAARGPYCGAIGWIDADHRTARLAVGIRTFWIDDDVIRFGTGAGITWGSDPGGEWRETELKSSRLIRIASQSAGPGRVAGRDAPARPVRDPLADQNPARTGMDPSRTGNDPSRSASRDLGDGVPGPEAVAPADAASIAWLNGELVPCHGAGIRLDDRGFTVGDGVFETALVRDGAVFALHSHLERLGRSTATLGLPAPDLDEIISGVDSVLRANDQDLVAGPARLRITHTSGPGELASARSGTTGTTLITLALSPAPAESVSLATAPWPRNERSPLAGAKATSFAENLLMLSWAREQGFGEALLHNLAGELAEGATSNVFVVLGDLVLTPPLSAGCLGGVTRGLVLEHCSAEESPLFPRDLAIAREVFITSATRGIQPVHLVDDLNFPAPGAVTLECAALFDRIREPDSPLWYRPEAEDSCWMA